MKHMLGFNDSFVSCYRNDMARFQIKFHVPIFCPFIKFVKVLLERKSLTVEVILSGISLM